MCRIPVAYKQRRRATFRVLERVRDVPLSLVLPATALPVQAATPSEQCVQRAYAGTPPPSCRVTKPLANTVVTRFRPVPTALPVPPCLGAVAPTRPTVPKNVETVVPPAVRVGRALVVALVVSSRVCSLLGYVFFPGSTPTTAPQACPCC